jgi:hypothetical protein
MAAGYIHDPLKGYLLRAWLHLDGQRLSFVKEKDGAAVVRAIHEEFNLDKA